MLESDDTMPWPVFGPRYFFNAAPMEPQHGMLAELNPL
jgi:hypothetical protein